MQPEAEIRAHLGELQARLPEQVTLFPDGMPALLARIQEIKWVLGEGPK